MSKENSRCTTCSPRSKGSTCRSSPRAASRRRRAARAARDAGADAVAAGTAFLVAEEADRHPDYVGRLLAAEDAVLTDVFSIGWPDAKHRVLANAALAEGTPASDAMPTGTRGGDADRMALYAGTGVRALRRVEPAAAIVDRLTLEPCGP